MADQKVQIKISADTGELVQAFDKARKGAEETAAGLKKVAQSSGKGFDASGINAAAAALAKVNTETKLAAQNAAAYTSAMRILDAQAKSGAISKADYAKATARLKAEFTDAGRAAGKMGADVQGLSAGLGGLQGVAGTALAGLSFAAIGKDLLDASLAADKLSRSLQFSAGSKTAGSAELAYISEASDRLGLSFASAADAYAKFSAAARGSALEGQGARDVFESVSKAATVMGLSGEESSGIFLALSQMMAKGKVSAEEFRGQLGERLPIATRVAADALGVTTAEFSKMLDSGQLLSEDFLPKFSAALEKAVGKDAQEAAGSLAAQINKLGSAWEQLKRNAADSEGFFGAVVKGTVQAAADLTKAAAGMFSNESMEETKEAGRVYDDLRAGIDRLTASGVAFSDEFVKGLKGAYVAGNLSAEETVKAFSEYEKRLRELAQENVAAVRTMSEEEGKAQVKLYEQIMKAREDRVIAEEKKNLSTVDFAIRQVQREAEERRRIAGDNSGMLVLIEEELQTKIDAIRKQAEIDRVTQEMRITDIVKGEAEERVGIERRAAESVAASWERTARVKSSGLNDPNGTVASNSAAFWEQFNKNFDGFATGGSFMVGGQGGTDSQLVAFRASPDERVTIETPEQQRSGRGNVTINVNVSGGNPQNIIAAIRNAMRTQPDLLSAGAARAG